MTQILIRTPAIASPVSQRSVHPHGMHVSDEFLALFLDPSRTFSCAKFYAPTVSLQEAQFAKIDLALSKCELRPGQKLLDIGCGWGSTVIRARQHAASRAVGVTTSKTECAYARQIAGNTPNLEFRNESWETLDEPADRIVCIDAFPYFGRKKYGAFFAKCRALLPDNGVLLVQTMTQGKPNFDDDFLRFASFLAKYIFPTGDIPSPELVMRHARLNRFETVSTESMRMDQALTFDAWAANLKANREKAVALEGVAMYRTFRKYFAISAEYFRSAQLNVHQFKLRPI